MLNRKETRWMFYAFYCCKRNGYSLKQTWEYIKHMVIFNNKTYILITLLSIYDILYTFSATSSTVILITRPYIYYTRQLYLYKCLSLLCRPFSLWDNLSNVYYFSQFLNFSSNWATRLTNISTLESQGACERLHV